MYGCTNAEYHCVPTTDVVLCPLVISYYFSFHSLPFLHKTSKIRNRIPILKNTQLKETSKKGSFLFEAIFIISCETPLRSLRSISYGGPSSSHLYHHAGKNDSKGLLTRNEMIRMD